MLEHAALQQCSGKTLVSYANLIGVSRHKMHYWVRKYKASQKNVKNDTSLKFIDLGSDGPGSHQRFGIHLHKSSRNTYKDVVWGTLAVTKSSAC
jgi:hypothetical protein